MRDGWGRRHPEMEALLARCRPVADRDESWWGGELPLHVRAFVGGCEAPDDVITSVRCIVTTDGGLVRCNNEDGSHFWPGGRREPDETHAQTAVREVREETGWRIDPRSLVALGWLHFEYLTARPPDWPFPHPDFVQLLYAGRAHQRDATPDGRDWTDTDGWEQSSDIVGWDDVEAEADELTRPFFALLQRPEEA